MLRSRYIVQSVIFDKDKFSKREARAYMKKHFEFKKIDETTNTYRCRIHNPDPLEEHGYSFFVKDLRNGIKLVIARR